MKTLTIQQRDNMIEMLEMALEEIRLGYSRGMCSSLLCILYIKQFTKEDANYLINWIQTMVPPGRYLEFLVNPDYYKYPNKLPSPEERYQLRKPWVEWMIQHLRETVQ